MCYLFYFNTENTVYSNRIITYNSNYIFKEF